MRYFWKNESRDLHAVTFRELTPMWFLPQKHWGIFSFPNYTGCPLNKIAKQVRGYSLLFWWKDGFPENALYTLQLWEAKAGFLSAFVMFNICNIGCSFLKSYRARSVYKQEYTIFIYCSMDLFPEICVCCTQWSCLSAPCFCYHSLMRLQLAEPWWDIWVVFIPYLTSSYVGGLRYGASIIMPS